MPERRPILVRFHHGAEYFSDADGRARIYWGDRTERPVVTSEWVPNADTIQATWDTITKVKNRTHGGGSVKIDVIEWLRKLTGLGLKEAKDVVEAVCEAKQKFTFVRATGAGPLSATVQSGSIVIEANSLDEARQALSSVVVNVHCWSHLPE